jgi:hypothetical protein
MLLCQGNWQDTFEHQCVEMGQYMAAGLDVGMF